MTNAKSKQLKIDKLFKKRANVNTEDFSDLEEEIRQLESTLKKKELELFEINKLNLKRKFVPSKRRKTMEFVKPERILLENSIATMNRNLELYAMLSGMEVRSYIKNDTCCVMYHMQNHTKHALQHGLSISLGQNALDKISFPVGFDYKKILEDDDKICRPECLLAIRKGLVAFYDRLEQCDKLRELLSYNGQLFKKLDGTFIEVTTFVQSTEDLDSEPVDIQLVFTYRTYDIRPKHFSIGNVDLPESEKEKLDSQCAVFKRQPLHIAMKECFIDGHGPYKLNSSPYLENARKE